MGRRLKRLPWRMARVGRRLKPGCCGWRSAASGARVGPRPLAW